MKVFANSFAGFIICILQFLVSDAHPYQLHTRSHHDGRRISLTEGETDFHPSSNWTTSYNNQRIPVTTSNINRGFIKPPKPQAPFTSTKVDKIPHVRVKKETCIHGFCEDVEDYPEALIKRVLSKSNALDAYFREAEVAFELNNRGAFNDEEDSNDSICPTKTATYYPKTATNTKNVERILVNVENHKQVIVFETCLEKASCRFSDSFPIGFSSSCKQKYVRRNLAVIDIDKESPSWDTFEIPSCCVCVIKRDGKN